MTVFLKDYIPEIDVMEKLPQIESDNIGVFPGFCDVHVHFREPGFSYKETIRTGSLAAARGGYTAVCTMPNLNPVPDSTDHLKAETDIIRSSAAIDVYPYGAVTVGEKGETLSDFEGMSRDVIAFSDDGRGVQDDGMMEEAMTEAKRLDKIIAAHCEVNALLDGGYIHKGRYCTEHGHRGICSESEWKQIERDISLAKKTGCAYHVCHISCRESVELIRKAKADGVDITCETAPHYLLLDENDLKESGNFKMNPPLRSREDREALLNGVIDGTVDMIATDHAPHSDEEKAKGLQGSPFGIVGIETAFPLLYTSLVRENVITLDRLLRLMCVNPRQRFGIPYSGSYTVWDLDKKYVIDPKDFISKGKSTPFEGREVFGQNLLTVLNGEIKYKLS